MNGMHQLTTTEGTSKVAVYKALAQNLGAIIEGERDFLANTANMSALINQSVSGINWVGFYFLKGSELVLGPFQGKVACIRIALGRGVCGTAAARRETVVVPDVEKFPGHIACDSASRSEIVVPLLHDGQLYGVLDVDSPELGRFDAEDAAGLGRLVRILMNGSELPVGLPS